MLIHTAFASAKLQVWQGIGRKDKEQLAKAAARNLTSVRTDLDALLAAITRGGIYFPARLKDDSGSTAVDNFADANLVVLDIDNTNPDEPTLSWSDALQHPYIQQHAAFLHESPNYTPEQNRFRIGFLLPEAITDYDTWKTIAQRIGDNLPQQFDIILRPTWGFKGCRTLRLGNGLNVMSRAEFEQLGSDILHRTQERTHRQRTQEHDTGERISLEEAERILSLLPPQLEYNEWQAVVFGIANTFEEHEAIQLIQAWSPGRDRHFINLIRRNRKRKYATSRSITIATVIDMAKRYGYIPPAVIHLQRTMAGLVYDRTMSVQRWVSEAADKIKDILRDQQKTILVSRTGNGKSHLIKTLAASRSILLVSPLAKLTEQQAEEFKDAGAVSVTGGEEPDIAELYFQNHRFVCTTPEMLASYMQCIDRFDLVVLDEIHELRRIDYRKTALAALDECLQRARKVLGLTATLTDNIFHEQGFYILNIQDCRHERVSIIHREFSGGGKDNKPSEVALAIQLIAEHYQTSNETVLVIRLQSKNGIRMVRSYCTDILQFPKQELAVLTSEEKNTSEVFETIVASRSIPQGIRVLLTTSVADLGINVHNDNIARIALIEPTDAVEIIQFSSRFRNAAVPVECFFRQKMTPTEQEPEPQKPIPDLLWLFGKNIRQADDLCTLMNITIKPDNKGMLQHSVSVSRKFKSYVRFVADRYTSNHFIIAADLYRDYTLALRKNRQAFFENLTLCFPYCDARQQQTLDLDADAKLQLLQEQSTEREKQIRNALLDTLSSDRHNFLLNVFHAHVADRELRRVILKEWDGIRFPESSTSKKLKHSFKELFGENIFARPFAKTLTKRFSHLRTLLFDANEAIRLITEHNSNEQWHNLTLKLETLRRQFLLQKMPHALSAKWKREAECIDKLALALQQRKEITTKELHSFLNETAKSINFPFLRKREAAKLVKILFGKSKRRGKEKHSYYDCQNRQSFQDTLQALGIDAVAYLNLLEIHCTLVQEKPAPAKTGLASPAEGYLQHIVVVLDGGVDSE